MCTTAFHHIPVCCTNGQWDMVTSVWHGDISLTWWHQCGRSYNDSSRQLPGTHVLQSTGRNDIASRLYNNCNGSLCKPKCTCNMCAEYKFVRSWQRPSGQNILQPVVIDWLIDWFCHIYVCSSRSMCQLSQRSNEPLQYHVCRLSDTFRNTKAACWAEILALRHSYSFTSTTVWWQGSCH